MHQPQRPPEPHLRRVHPNDFAANRPKIRQLVSRADPSAIENPVELLPAAIVQLDGVRRDCKNVRGPQQTQAQEMLAGDGDEGLTVDLPFVRKEVNLAPSGKSRLG